MPILQQCNNDYTGGGVMSEFKRSRVDGREIDREKSKQVTHRGT